MKLKHQKIMHPCKTTIHVMLADDDADDRYFYNKALKALPFPTEFTMVENGEKLMRYLLANTEKLPDVLFLDYNMPRKNGSECLLEIKQHPLLKKLPIIICSTYLHGAVADVLYTQGADYYVHKTDFKDLETVFHQILTSIAEKKFKRPAREQFILH